MAESIQKGFMIEDIPMVKPFRPEWDENNEEIRSIWSKIFKTGIRSIMAAFIVLLVMAFTAGATGNGTNETPDANATGTDTVAATAISGAGTASDGEEELLEDIEDYNGPIGPGNSIYRLKLAFEALDVTFTFNESEKLGKQVAYARQRIAEMKAELKKNNNEAASRALEGYREEMKELDETTSEASDKDTGLLHAQRMIAKHQAVLKELVDLHPNNTGLARAYNNSLELEEKFESRTGKEFVIIAKNGKKVLREMEIDETKEKLKIKVEVTGNATKVKVEVKFASNATDNFTIAQEILNRLKLNQENINSIMKVEIEDEEEDEEELKEELEAEAEIRGDVSKVELDFRFPLSVTNRSDIAEGIYTKLSSLTQADILNVLEMKVKKEKTEIKETGRKAENTVNEDREEKQNKTEKRTENEIEDSEETTQTRERDERNRSGRED